MDTPLTKRRWFRRIAITAVLLGICLGLVVVVVLQARPAKIKSFAVCAAYGFPVTISEPKICSAKGVTFKDTAVSVSTPALTAINFTSLYRSDAPSAYPSANQIITSPSEWKKYWQGVHSYSATPVTLPEVDFTKKSVVAISLGSYRSTVVGIKVVSVRSSSQETLVVIEETLPAETCVALSFTSNPTVAIEFDKQVSPIRLKINTSSQDCN